jgi:hypothetical protein
MGNTYDMMQTQEVSHMADSQAKRDWMKANTTVITIKLNHRTDADILERLTSVDNRNGYIKQLIREDIAKTEK